MAMCGDSGTNPAGSVPKPSPPLVCLVLSFCLEQLCEKKHCETEQATTESLRTYYSSLQLNENSRQARRVFSETVTTQKCNAYCLGEAPKYLKRLNQISEFPNNKSNWLAPS